MTNTDPYLAFLGDPRLTAHAASPVPAWLWTPDATRMVWANAAGAALMGAIFPAELTGRQFPPQHPVASQIARLAAGLPRDGAAQTEQLHGMEAGSGQAALCSLKAIALDDGTTAILVVAQTPAAKPLPKLSPTATALAPHPVAPATTETGTALNPSSELARTAAPAGGERRHPLRFVWQMDQAGRFTLGPSEFAGMMGPREAALMGQTWDEIAKELGIDPEGRVAAAIASRDTWSGIVVPWPVGRKAEPVDVELSGLPMFDRNRGFLGYRGFGICRDVAWLYAAGAREAEQPAAPTVAPNRPLQTTIIPGVGPAAQSLLTPPKTLLSLPASQPNGSKQPSLTPVERTTFREIAKVLGADAKIPDKTSQETPADPASPPNQEPSASTPDAPAPDASNIAAAPQTPPARGETTERFKQLELAQRAAENEARELRSILDTATDGVIVVERNGHILSLNRSAEALFGYESHELLNRPFVELFAPESHRAALDYLDGLASNGVASILNDGREIIGQVRQGGLIPLFMTMGRMTDGAEKFCAVFRDITQWKRAEEELLNAKRQAERTSSAKSDLLAKISHEIRTPLNAILGFSEVMMEQKFGPIENERYREYLKDIHASGGHLVSLINDLLDLSKIEAGKLDLVFASVSLNDIIQQCVALMQPQANRERIIIRTSLLSTLPPVVVDARSIRQIVLNLLSNSIKFTRPGGQVIVSTAFSGQGEAILRVRDTGIGMSEKEIETALEPFRQLATSARWGSGGTGLGLPLTKALVEANRASFAIKSAVNAGTLVEITFPSMRVLAE